MLRQLSFNISDEDNMDGALTAYARQWLLIVASELPFEKRSLTALAGAVGTTRQRIARWLDALQIRKQIEDRELLEGSDYKEPLRTRPVSFTILDNDTLDGAITAYAREWLLLVASSKTCYTKPNPKIYTRRSQMYIMVSQN